MDNEYVKKIIETEERSKSNTKRLDKHDKDIEELKKTYAIMEKMDYRMGQVEDSIKIIDNKLDKQVEKKGMKWDKLIDYIFYAILAVCLLRLGLK